MLLTMLLAIAHADPPEDTAPPPAEEPRIRPYEAPPTTPEEPVRQEVRYGPEPVAEPAEEPAAETPAPPPADDAKHFELQARFRYVSVPQAMMDLWYTGDVDASWPLDEDRPKLAAMTYGLEFNVQKRETIGIFYLEYAQSFISEGFWDDRENPVFYDGDYWKPSRLLGAVIIGANGAYDAEIVAADETGGKFAMSFLVGGGLGIAAIVGSIDEWGFDRTTGSFAYEKYQQGAPPDRNANLGSPVWPIPDFFMAFKFVVVDHFTFRLEGGIHGGFQYGGSIGGRF